MRIQTLAVLFLFTIGLLQSPRLSLGGEPSYPLRVRGGPALRCALEATKTPSLSKLVVIFAPSPQGGAKLAPGQGGWNDRALRPGEPARLEYFAQEMDAKKIFDYLRSPSAYYVFECFNTRKGFLQVTRAYPKSVRID